MVKWQLWLDIYWMLTLGFEPTYLVHPMPMSKKCIWSDAKVAFVIKCILDVESRLWRSSTMLFKHRLIYIWKTFILLPNLNIVWTLGQMLFKHQLHIKCLKSVSLETTKFFVREPRYYFAGKYSHSVPEISFGFYFPVLPVLAFCPFPWKFPFPVPPRANPRCNLISGLNLVKCGILQVHIQNV